jgi:hypothetical protein
MSKPKFFLLTLVAVLAISSGAIWLFQFIAKDEPYSEHWTPKRPRAEVEAACKEHLREAETKAAAAIRKRVSEFSQFIESRKPGAKPFSQEVVSYYGKWRAVSPYLPFTNKEGHKKYVIEKFDTHIFTNEQLAAAIRSAVEASVKDLESIENELAVALRREILGRSLAPDEVPIAGEEFKKAVERLVSGAQWDAFKSAGKMVAFEVLMRLGVSAWILSTGAANSWWSLGASAVIGLVVDAIWEWIDDPAGDIEREMITALDKLSSDASTAIKEEMSTVVAQRSVLWEKTVTEMLP